MKIKFKCIAIVVLMGFSYGCFEDGDDNIAAGTSIKDFVWKAMNVVYLYKSNVNDLSNDRFATNTDYQNYLNSNETPEALFEALIYDRENIDRFSYITSNYFELEQQLSGVTLNNGAEFNFYIVPGSTTSVFGVVRLVHPNSSASAANLSRGQVFNKINDIALNTSNFSSLLANNSYSLSLAIYDDNDTETLSDDQILDGDETITLVKEGYEENPIFHTAVIDVNTEKVGYLMYNSFVNEFDSELNVVFGDFKSQNIDHLILDLRYNSGGSVQTATALGSMVTGQFQNQVFTTLKYNETLETNNFDYNFTNTLSNDEIINSLNLEKVYILTSNRSASASEMMVNSLKSYIEVVQIGGQTVGKSQASQIIYDSANLGRENANPGHTYALLPLIAITVNKNDETVPPSGIIPTINLLERPANYGIIGDTEEPLLKAALEDIQGSNRLAFPSEIEMSPNDLNVLNPLETLMYIE
jgi:C-terminal processing protease CtpA/Prc